jgi:single-strand DNA-binding protein
MKTESAPMANLNKVMLIGRLTRDPEPILSGKGAKFGFAVNNRKLNSETQQWEEVAVFIDMEVWNRGEMGKQADLVLRTLRKGHQVFIEGHLKLDQWEDKNGGGKRSALRVVVESFQYLEPRTDGTGESMARAPRPAATGAAPSRAAAYSNDNFDDGPSMAPPARLGGGGESEEEHIPF